MENDFAEWVEQFRDDGFELHQRHLNPAFVKMLRAIGFERQYVRGEGAYLFDDEGNKYLDLLTGWGVFALGRNHPKIKSVLKQLLDMDRPNLVRMDCSILSGLAAQALVRHTPDGMSRVFFTNSGTETVEAALKFARCATGKQDIIYLRSRIPRPDGRSAFRQRRSVLPSGIWRHDSRRMPDSV